MVALLVGCAPAAEIRGEWQISSAAGDELTVIERADELRIEVRSKTGIGSAVVTPPASGWPQVVELRLYLSGLESLRLESGEVGIQGFVPNHSDGQPKFQLSRAGEQSETARQPEFAFFDRRSTDGCLVLVLDAATFAKTSKPLGIAWVDFFR